MKCTLSAIVLSLAGFFATSSLVAQNLVPNPSFESKTGCPSLPGQINLCNSWSKPNTASPDYLHTCATGSTVKIPTNMWGSQAARTGSAYAQLLVFPPSLNFREYIQAQLLSALVAGKTYTVTFYVSRCDKTRYAIKNMGAHLSTSALGPFSNNTNINVVPQVEHGSIITDKTNWTKVEGDIVAVGGEKFITIGNFRNTAGTTNSFVQTTGHVNAAYYIEDVSVVLKPQGFTTDQLVGFADLPSPAATGFLDIQDVINNCKPAYTQCKTKVPLRATVPYAGGTAYDPRYQTVWMSDGTVLAEYRVQPGGGMCKQRCPFFKGSKANVNAWISGLACSDKKPRLFQLATLPGYMEIATYNTSTKCPTKPWFCKSKLPEKSVATGLAYDEVRDLLYVIVATPMSGGGWTHTLFVSKANNPCVPICKTRIYTCSKSLVTGLAYETCRKRLFVTDGQVTQTYYVGDPQKCLIKQGKCCKKQTAPVWRGLAVIPGWRNKVVGTSCTSPVCATCTSMQTYTVGDPSLGNTFRIGVQNAPSGGFAALYLKVGTTGSGINLPPPFCGTWYAFPSVFAFPMGALGGGGTCGGNRLEALPIPTHLSLCSKTITAQWFIFCASGSSFGLGFSNALEFTISSS